MCACDGDDSEANSLSLSTKRRKMTSHESDSLFLPPSFEGKERAKGLLGGEEVTEVPVVYKIVSDSVCLFWFLLVDVLF